MTEITIALAGLTCICGLLFIYPYAVYPLTLKLLRKRAISKGDGGTDGQGFALFFCAYNEIAVIQEKVANVRQLCSRYPQLQIFAYDDASSDGTLDVLESASDVITVTRGAGRTGKAHGMKKMVAAATQAEFLIFTDANVLVDLDAVDEFYRCYQDSEVGAVCGTLHYRTSDQATATEVTGGLYWRIEEWIKGLESATGNVMGADGSLFSVRKALYPDFPDTVQDDFTVSMAAVFAGRRLVKTPDAIAFEKLVSIRSDEKQRKVRIAARAFHTHRVMQPGRRRLALVDRYKYAAHKTLRWWGAVPLLVGSISGAGFLVSLGLPGIVCLGALLAATAGVFLVRPGFGHVASDFLIAVLATLIGVLRALRGQTVVIWAPPTSR